MMHLLHSIMQQTRESIGYRIALERWARERQSIIPSLGQRKRRRLKIWHGRRPIGRLITQRLWSVVWFSCGGKEKKKGNTNGCHRTGLFSRQTAVQHQTEQCLRCAGDTQLQRLTGADTAELVCQGDIGCQSQTGLSKPSLSQFLPACVLPSALWQNSRLRICCHKSAFSVKHVVSSSWSRIKFFLSPHTNYDVSILRNKRFLLQKYKFWNRPFTSSCCGWRERKHIQHSNSFHCDVIKGCAASLIPFLG